MSLVVSSEIECIFPQNHDLTVVFYSMIRNKLKHRETEYTNNGQAIYKNRTLTHNLQQPAQETNSLSPLNLGSQLCRKPDGISRDNLGSQTIMSTEIVPKL